MFSKSKKSIDLKTKTDNFAYVLGLYKIKFERDSNDNITITSGNKTVHNNVAIIAKNLLNSDISRLAVAVRQLNSEPMPEETKKYFNDFLEAATHFEMDLSVKSNQVLIKHIANLANADNKYCMTADGKFDAPKFCKMIDDDLAKIKNCKAPMNPILKGFAFAIIGAMIAATLGFSAAVIAAAGVTAIKVGGFSAFATAAATAIKGITATSATGMTTLASSQLGALGGFFLGARNGYKNRQTYLFAKQPANKDLELAANAIKTQISMKPSLG